MVICKVRDVFTIHEVQKENHSVRWAGAGGWCWSGVREKHCWLAGGWRLVLERCEKKTLLSWRRVELPNTVNFVLWSCFRHIKMGLAILQIEGLVIKNALTDRQCSAQNPTR